MKSAPGRGARVIAVLTGLMSASNAAPGQTPPKLEFDVASVKPANPQQTGFAIRGGPGTSEPVRLTYSNVPLQRILLTAYGIKTASELSGPSWMETAKYDIAANIPAGTTAEQLNIMLQNLLAERFHLTLHHETKEFSVYELIFGKGGSKLKASDLTASSTPSLDGTTTDKNGFPNPPPGRSIVMRYSLKGRLRMTGRLQTPEQIAQMLSGYVGNPVVNKTGLTGKYDFTLEFAEDYSPESTEPAPSVSTAVQEQLGLRLDKTKALLDVFVIDHIDKAPTEN